MQILITGNSVFVGSHPSKKPVGEGHNVICLDGVVNDSLILVANPNHLNQVQEYLGSVANTELPSFLLNSN